MSKALVIARREYVAMVGSKAFLITVAIMPLFMLGGVIIPRLIGDQVDVTEKRIAVIDGSGELLPALQQVVRQYNRQGVLDPESGKQIRPRFRLQEIRRRPIDDDLRLQLSDQVRSGEIYAFLEIPEDVFELPADGEATVVSFYAESAVLSEVKSWFAATISSLVQERRLRSAGIDPAVVAGSRAIKVAGRGLFKKDASGKVQPASKSQEVVAVFLPLAIMMFMFMLVMMAAQPMLESVLEEKMNRIAEVLLGSATPVQIMSGKLVGNVAGSLTIAAIYIAGGYAMASYNGLADSIPLRIGPWFLAFQILAVVMFSSLFLAIGASVNQLKEAQSLLLPVWVLLVVPMFVWFNVVREPNSSFATWLSMTPPFIPMIMCLRLAVSNAVPPWQPAVGLAIMLAVTVSCVVVAGRVFRVGILVQGQAPKFSQLVRWAVRG